MKQHFKQAWNLIKQEKLFSFLYIIGTGLSITIVMVLSIVYYIKLADIYPEMSRDKILIAKNGVEERKNGGQSSAALSYHTLETCFRPLCHTDAVSALYQTWDREHYVQPLGNKEQLPVSVQYVDTDFWKIFSFRFVQGKPFSEADFQSGIPTAVISESLAKRLFGSAAEANGQSVSLNFMPYKICGVVKDVSYVMELTYAQLWIPYTVNSDYKNSFAEGGTLGQFKVVILPSDDGDKEKIRREALDNIQKMNSTLPDDIELKLLGQPESYWKSSFRYWSNQEPDFTKIIWQNSLIFLILLLIPAISLSGMADSRMERRLAEMGIRRAFGAPVNTLMRQILTENFLFTLLGGMIGLLFSYLIVLIGSDWIMGIGKAWTSVLPEGTEVVITPAMLINIPVFLITLTVCFLLNLLTAIIPAWRASHRDIIHSLNAKQ